MLGGGDRFYLCNRSAVLHEQLRGNKPCLDRGRMGAGGRQTNTGDLVALYCDGQAINF